MPKLLVVVDASGIDQLLVLVPDVYAETEIEDAGYKGEMKEPVIYEIDLEAEQVAQLREAGVHEGREYWG